MSTTIGDRLRDAAQAGDINLLYTLIQEDPCVLEDIDSIPFVETPLHVAASFGHLPFATEVMRLKPSFAQKLNRQGFSPIHLAMQHGQKRMVLRLVNIDNDLVRVKGREGFTPLHVASQNGDVDLLVDFLFACPDSIEDVTIWSETALHVAVRNEQYEALQVLVCWLKKTRQKGSLSLESIILNWKDEAGNTILHISALKNFSQALRLLVKTEGVRLNTKNLDNSTAVDIAKNGSNAEILSILCGAGAKERSSDIAPTRADKLKSKITFIDKTLIPIIRLRSEITEEQRNAFLVVAALVATAGFQTALSPPGGVYQANAGDIVNTTSLAINSTATATTAQGNVGKSVMSLADFKPFTLFSAFCLVFSTITIYLLTPDAKVSLLLIMPIFTFFCSYIYSMKVISPSQTHPKGFDSSVSFYLGFAALFLVFLVMHWIFLISYKRLQYHTMNREARIRNRTRGNRW